MSDPSSNLDRVGILDEGGHRNYVYPADVKGRFTRLKPYVYYALIAIWAILPWVHIGGNPAVFIDIASRKFYLFGQTFNAQDVPLVFFLLTGIGFSLIVVSTLFGRVWCGWACPQTVFLEGVFRRVERLIEGPANTRRALAKAPWTASKFLKKGLLHGVYLLAAFAIAHIFVSYFVSMPALWEMVGSRPGEHWTVFLWAAVLTGILYFNFSWFREQLCLVICPYGRLQSALQDDDTIVIGYDALRGEPRGKVSDPGAGDCVNCKRCVVVCPTGIDIRDGLQLECIGCAACVDACDEIMIKVGRPTGLVRYDSLKALEGGVRRFWRPRVFAYLIAGMVGLTVATGFIFARSPFEANVLHVHAAPYVLDGDTLRNQLNIHLVNKHPVDATFHVDPVEGGPATFIVPQAVVEVGSLGSRNLPVVVSLPREDFTPGMTVEIRISDSESNVVKTLSVTVLGPKGAGTGG